MSAGNTTSSSTIHKTISICLPKDWKTDMLPHLSRHETLVYTLVCSSANERVILVQSFTTWQKKTDIQRLKRRGCAQNTAHCSGFKSKLNTKTLSGGKIGLPIEINTTANILKTNNLPPAQFCMAERQRCSILQTFMQK